MSQTLTPDRVEPLEIPGVDLLEEVGRGAHSVVYRALLAGEVCAVKVRREVHGGDTGRFKTRYLTEAAVLARFSHPGLAGIIEAGETADRGRPYLIMEYVDGLTLAEVLDKTSPLEQAQIVDIATTIASALADVHRHGVIHRDIKPRNILVRADDGAIKLIDFGFAARTPRSEARSKAGGKAGEGVTSVVGTLRYSAPEQAGMLQRPVDARSDLYSLGVVLYECAAGRPPFEAEDPAELVRQHAVDEPAAVIQRNAAITPALARIIEKLLAKDPDDRYDSCGALVADLERIDQLDATFERGEALRLGHRSPAGQLSASPPLFGRHREYSRLESAWLQARSGRGQICWISGASGSGTTRLVEQFLADGVDANALVLEVSCSQTPETPFAAVRRAGENFVNVWRNLPPETAASWMAHIETASQEHMPMLTRLVANALELPDAARRFVAEDSGTPQRFAESIASFFLELATADHPVVFVIDEIADADDASLQVLRQVASRLERRHLLLVCIAGEAPDTHSGPDAFLDDADRLPLSRLQLGSLDERAVGDMIAYELGGDGLPERAVRQITARTQGVPLAVREYVFSMLEAGLLRPVRDGWILDADGLASMELPTDVTHLMVRRLEELGDGARQVLRAAAVKGQRFELSLCSKYCCGVDSPREVRTVSDAIGEAIHLRLVEHLSHDVYAFVHKCIRDALLDELDEPERRAIHQRIAEVLDDPQADGDAHLFSVAHHYALGEVDVHGERVYQTNLQAGLLALRNNASEDAYAFLTTAQRHALDVVDATLVLALGEACAATGRVDEANEHFQDAVELSETPIERARLRARIARVRMAVLEMDDAWDHIQLALDELDSSVPSSSLLRGFGSVFAWLFAFVLARVPFLAGNSNAVASPTRRLRADLYELGAITAFFRLDYDLMGALILRALFVARRLADGAEKARVFATYAAVLAILGRKEAAKGYAARAVSIAQSLLSEDRGDRGVIARVRWFEATTVEFAGEAPKAERLLRDTLKEHGLWLELWEYVIVCGQLGGLLIDRGFVRDAASWGQRILDRTKPGHGANELDHMERVYGLYLNAVACAWAAKSMEAHAFVEQANALLEGRAEIGLGEASAVGYELAVHFECGNRGEEVERLLERWAGFDLVPNRLPHQIRRFYVYQAYLRLDQYRWARKPQKKATRARFLSALDELNLAADTPKYQTHLCVIRSEWEAMQGEDERSQALLARAEALADEANSPWGRFEVEVCRARKLNKRGNFEAALRRARHAHTLAVEHGWSHRARDLRTEFDFYVDNSISTGTTSRSYGRSRSGSEGSTNAVSLKLERYLDSLLEVAIASGTVFDPEEQARVALDEIVRIFGAERAFLFGGEQAGDLEVIAGRDVRGHNLGDCGDYSKSVIERVLAERRPIVSTGSDEGEVLASASAVRHNLRSIMAGPVQIRDNFLGVVYVDSRIARGVFASDDAEILMAISSHIGIAQETARAAQLEVDIESERKKRELAEVIRRTTTEMTATLDQAEVLERLLEGTRRLVEADRAVAFLLRDDALELYVEHRDDGTKVGEASDWVLGDLRIERVMDTAKAQFSGQKGGLDPALDGVDADHSWLGAPIITRGKLAGMMLLERDEPHAYGQDHVHLVLALTGQAAIALENARLFAQVERLAVLDDLTQLPNRRRLFEVAENAFKRAKRYDRPMSVIMLDIDHFKQVNDTYGHAIGDDILRTVAQRCAEALRETDTVGRYGGEEFVVVMPQTGLEEARECVAERLRAEVAEHPVETEKGAVSVTISLGVAELSSVDEDLDALLNRADEALYAAKEGGRNRVEIARNH
jgi:diguanylate cyclase (GGDEF)-like protein